MATGGASPAAQAPQVAFRPVEAADFPLLLRWLRQPHVREFYQKTEPSLDEVAAKYGAYMRGEQPTICHIALSAGEPFAYLQCYRNADWPGWAAMIGHADGISVDLYIGESAFHRRGFGRAMLAAYLRDVGFAHFAEADHAYIAHELANRAAIGCSKAVGFKDLGRFIEDGKASMLLGLARADVPGG